MSLNQFHKILATYQDIRPLLPQYCGEERAAQWSSLVQAKTLDATPAIMVYGVYNAGKSTLINALVGQNLAVTADKPQTDRIEAYTWQGFRIFDTPGIDAPIEHENVTLAQLERSDVVIFVLGSSGVSEEMETYHSIVDLVQRRRKTMVVINNKTGLEPGSANEYALIDKVRYNLQKAAQEKSISDILQAVPVVMVNAASALKAKLENKQNLLRKSMLPELEKQLLEFLRASNSSQVLRTLASELEKAATQGLENLTRQESEGPLRDLSQIQGKLEREETLLRQELERSASHHARKAQTQMREILLKARDPQATEDAIAELIESMLPMAQQDLERLLTESNNRIADFAQNMESDISSRPLGSFTQDFETPTMGKETAKTFNPALALQLKDMLQHLSTDHIVTALKAAKDLLPALFKGIGPKTMGKIAEKIVTKIPFIGPFLNLAVGLYEIYQARKREQEQREEQERFYQAVMDAAKNFGESLREHIEEYYLASIEAAFQPMKDKIATMYQNLDAKSRELGADKIRLQQALEVFRREQTQVEAN